MIEQSIVININEQLAMQQIIKLMSLSTLSFIIAVAITPIFTHFAFKYKWWKQIKDTAWIGGGKEKAPVYYSLHKEKHKRNIPTMAGVIIWFTVAVITSIFNLDRAQTWLPLFTIVSIGLLGLIDDFVNIRSTGGIAGVKSKIKAAWILIFSGIGAYWFYYKLGWNILHIPAYGDVNVGIFYIPIFIFIVFATANAVNITDGLDGLAGGLLAASFGAYSVISFFQGNFGLASFCATVAGAVLAYTWFNIYPARFLMGDTGAVALGATLGVVAMLTNTALVLPVIGFVFVAETLSVIIQLTSKRLRNGKKVFLSAPVHHHLEAIGWPETKITMRLWIIGAISALMGVVISLLGRGYS